MIRFPRLWTLILPLAFLGPLTLATPVQAEESSEHDEDEDDSFSPNWFGVRLGFWYRPTMDMNVQVSGKDITNPLTVLLGTEVDVQRDLGLRANPISETKVDFDESVIPELEIFAHTRWVNVGVNLITPFSYEGDKILQKQVNFAGRSFSVSRRLKSRFKQFMAGVDLSVNILNNRYLRVGPMIGARVLGVDWEIKSVDSPPLSANTRSIDTPFTYEDFQLLPYPEVGLELALGLRDFVELTLRAAGSAVDYQGFEGGSTRFEGAVTVYPLPFIGFQLGFRYLEIDLKSKRQDKDDQFSFNTEFAGAQASVIVRF